MEAGRQLAWPEASFTCVEAPRCGYLSESWNTHAWNCFASKQDHETTQMQAVVLESTFVCSKTRRTCDTYTRASLRACARAGSKMDVV